jgi:hypothetical protein
MHQKTAKKHDNNQNQKLYLKSNQGQESLREARASGSPWPKTHYTRAHYSIANARFSS